MIRKFRQSIRSLRKPLAPARHEWPQPGKRRPFSALTQNRLLGAHIDFTGGLKGKTK